MDDNENLLKMAIDYAQKEGIEEVITKYNTGKTYQIRFSNSEIDNSKLWDEENLAVFMVKGKKTTQIDIEAPTPEKVKESISNGISFLKQLPDSFLFNGIESKLQSYRSIDGLLDKNIYFFSDKAPELINIAIQSALDEGAKKVAGVLYYGFSSVNLMTNYNQGSYEDSYFRLTTRSFVDSESSGQGISCGRNLKDVEEKFKMAGKESGEIAKMAIGGKQGNSGKYDLIMSPTVAANVLGQVIDGANPIRILIGMSPIKNKQLGTQIASDFLNVDDNALLSEGLGSRPFDVEGTPSGKTTIISNGILKGILHNTSTSIMDKVKNTGNSTFFDFGIGSKFLAPGSSNTVFNKGDHSVEEIIAESRRPTIYVTSNWYTRFTNMLEGTFSTIPRDGMFLIENGEILRPVRKLRLSDNLLRMLMNIDAMGKDIQQIFWWEVETPTFLPTIKVLNCNITSATQ